MVEYLKQIELLECNREALLALVDIIEKYTTEDEAGAGPTSSKADHPIQETHVCT